MDFFGFWGDPEADQYPLKIVPYQVIQAPFDLPQTLGGHDFFSMKKESRFFTTTTKRGDEYKAD